MQFGADRLTPLKRAARSKDERRFTLSHWLNNDWAAEDVEQLTRVEGSTPGWRMRRRGEPEDGADGGAGIAPMSAKAGRAKARKKRTKKKAAKARPRRPKR